jgi:hypothetical protein
MKQAIAHYLKQASEAGNEKDAMDYLRACPLGPAVLKQVFQLAYDPNIKWLLPEGAPPYNPTKFDNEGAIYSELRRMYLFHEGGNPNLTTVKREKLFIDLLEYVDPRDAELLIALKDGKIPYKNINQRMANKLFPGEFPTNTEKEKEATDDKENV